MFFLRKALSLLLIFVTALVAAHAFASSQENPLLRLIPPGSDIVAGIEDAQADDPHGWFLLVTHDNEVDFSDYLALTGVDSHRRVSKLVEVAASSPRGELKERLMLLSGKFERDHIFSAATANGASVRDYNGVRVLVVEPFARERQEMADTRWMAIPDNSTLIFGTPVMVKAAIDRYRTGQLPDQPLVDRLVQLPVDVSCWSVLAMPGTMLTKHIAHGHESTQWANVLEHADAMTLGIHYGSKARLDLVLETASEYASSTVVPLFQNGVIFVGFPDKSGAHIEKLTADKNRVLATITVSRKGLAKWQESEPRQSEAAQTGNSPLIP